MTALLTDKELIDFLERTCGELREPKSRGIVFTDKEIASIISDVAKIEDKELRLSLIKKLTNGLCYECKRFD